MPAEVLVLEGDWIGFDPGEEDKRPRGLVQGAVHELMWDILVRRVEPPLQA